ncbi:MAG TPA: phosphatidate cytidylyltransferase [Candidatus Angelobacter sp.]|jgi:phosphatidate cytidylyltransferase|nr:phosphatidate cytidylyltransferase [Candidatus Angelobacter sp.]
MKRVLTALVLIPVVLLILFKAPDWFYSGFIGLIAVLAAHEYFGIAIHYQEKLHAYVIEVAIGLYFLGQCLHHVSAFGIEHFGNQFESWSYDITSVRALPLILLVLGMFIWEMKDVLGAAAFSYFGFIYIAYTLGGLSLIGHQRNGRIVVFILLVVVWSGDIFAYYIGRAFGRHKLAESISPKKTWEGAIASALGAILVSVTLFRYIHVIGVVLVRLDAIPSRSILYYDVRLYAPAWWLAAAFGLLVNVAAQLGDLAESALKRGAGVKDSGTLLPGHGGFLDRIDALLFAAPVLWFFEAPLFAALSHQP